MIEFEPCVEVNSWSWKYTGPFITKFGAKGNCFERDTPVCRERRGKHPFWRSEFLVGKKQLNRWNLSKISGFPSPKKTHTKRKMIEQNDRAGIADAYFLQNDRRKWSTQNDRRSRFRKTKKALWSIISVEENCTSIFLILPCY